MKALLLGATLVLASCSGSSTSAGSGAHDITGTLLVAGSFKNGWVSAIPKEYCLVADSEGDIREGVQVKLFDEANTVIAVAVLEGGDPATLGDSVPFACQYTFRFEAVFDAKFYQVAIGRHDGPTISAEDLEAAGWEYAPLRL